MATKKKADTDAVEGIVGMLGKGLVSVFTSPLKLLCMGFAIIVCVWVMNNPLLLSEATGLSAYQMEYARYLIFIIPLLLLLLYGATNKTTKSMTEKFESIKFTNKVGQHPTVKRTYKDRKDRRIKIIEFYSPGIPITEWQKRKDEIESALDCTILSMKRDADSRQTIIAKTVSSKYKIPQKIDWDDAFIREEDFTLTVGEGLLGPITVNLNSMPHAIIAGTTGSGKSVVLRAMLWQAIKKGAKAYIIDFKGGVEFDQRWEDFAEVVMDKEPALTLLAGLVAEMRARLSRFREEGVKNITGYNKKHPDDPICHIVLACDELAELMDKEGITDKAEKKLMGEIEHHIASLARLARAAGIHMLLGLQRPDAKVLKGQIKNNAPIRICGRAEPVLSEIVLGTPKASEISNEEVGRFYCNIGGLREFQGYWFDDEAVLTDGNYQIGHMLTEGQPIQTEANVTIDESEYREFEASASEREEWADCLEALDSSELPDGKD